MTKSRQALVTRALQILRVVASGQAPAAEDSTLVDNQVEPMFANLASRDIWQWGDPDVIDLDAFEPLAQLLANICAKDFGTDYDLNIKAQFEGDLRALRPSMLSGQPQRTEYF